MKDKHLIYLLGDTGVSVLNFFGSNYEMTKEKVDAEILLVRSAQVVLEEFPSVKVIARLGKGIKNIPVDEATEKGILVVYAKDANATAVAQFVIRSMLDGLRNFDESRRFTQNIPLVMDNPLPYIEQNKERFRGRNTEGLNIGLIGASGDVCRALIPHLDLFGMNIFANDIVEVPKATNTGKVITKATIDQIVEHCDVISVHTDTPGMISNKQAVRMKEGAVFIDYARGVSLQYVDSLREKMPDIMAYSDFGTREWLSLQEDFPMNVFVSPHGAGLTDYAEEMCVSNIVQATRKFVETGVADAHSIYCINAKALMEKVV